MKNIIKTIIFLLIFSILFSIVYQILWLAPTSISYFYDEPKDSLDVIYIGSSNAYVHFNSVLAYNLYGFTTGLLSADAQSFALVKYLLKETEQYQHPAIYVLDIAKIADNFDDFLGEEIRNTTDSMKFTQNRINAINESLGYKKDIDRKDYKNYYFSFLMYHNKWKDIDRHSIVGSNFLYKGYKFTKMTTEIESQETYQWSNEVEDLQAENKMVLISLIDYIKTKKLNVLFVVPKRVYKLQDNTRINNAIEILEENDLKVINCNKIEELNNIDFKTDLYNERHLNVYGATKFSIYFSKYLKEHYELKDHRNDKNYASWEKEYERFKEDYKKLTNKNFEL